MHDASFQRPSAIRKLRALGEALELAPAHIVAVLIVASCASAGLVGLWWTAGGVAAPAAPGAETIASGAESSASSELPMGVIAPSMPPDEVVVHVSGAVVSPGVRTLQGGARVDDAVAAAGGATGSARTDHLNLARPVRDGEQIYVPNASEVATAASGVPGAAGPATIAGASGPAGRVNINRATAAELEELPGVGPVLAERIVTQRDSQGGFGAVEDLQEVPGIGEKTFAELKDLVTV